MRGSLRRVPAIKISKQRPGCGAVYAIQNGVVQFGTGLETFHGALGVPFFVCAQQIRRIVTQKLGYNARSAAFTSRYAHCTRGKDRLFALGLADAQVHDIHQLPGVIQTQLIAYLKMTIPAGCGDLALP